MPRMAAWAKGLVSGSLAGILLTACASSSAPAANTSSPAAPSSAAAKAAASTQPAASTATSPGSSPKPAATTAASAPAAASPKVVVAYTAVIPTILPEWLAYEAGIFKKNGLNIELVYIESSKGMSALIAGEVQVVVLGAAETVSAAAAGADILSVTTTASVYPYVLQVPASIKTLADLKGKKVGVSSFGSTSDIATRVALQKVGLDPAKDVSIIPVGSSVNRLAAMEAGAIQGGLAFLPDSLVLEAKGFHTLIDMTTLDAHWSNGSDIFMRPFVSANRNVVQKYVDSIVESIVRAKKDKALATDVMKKYEKIDDQHILDVTYDYYTKSVFQTLPYPKPEQYTDAKTIFGETNEAARNLDPGKVIDDSFVKNAAERGVDKQ